MRDQHGADRQQRERQRDLGDDERARDAAAAGARRDPHPIAQHVRRLRPRRLPERRETGQRAREKRHPDREHAARASRSRCLRRAECIAAAIETTSRTSARLAAMPAAAPISGDDHSFEEVLQRQRSVPRAERDANGRLACAGHGARQQQARDIGAGDQQQHAGRREQQEQRRTNAFDSIRVEIVEACGVAAPAASHPAARSPRRRAARRRAPAPASRPA